MAIAGIQVNTNGAGEVVGFTPLPKGKYEALIQGFEIKQESGNGFASTAIAFAFLVVAGEHKDRKIFERATIASGNPKAVAYGMRILNSLGKVINKPAGEWSDADLAALKGKRVILDIDVENERFDAASGKTYPARNRINGYEPVINGGGFAPAPAAAGVAPMQHGGGFGGAYGGGGGMAPMQQPQTYNSAPPQQAGTYPQAPQQGYAPQMPPAPTQQQPMLPPQSNYAAPPPAAAPPPPAAGAPAWMSGANG